MKYTLTVMTIVDGKGHLEDGKEVVEEAIKIPITELIAGIQKETGATTVVLSIVASPEPTVGQPPRDVIL